MASQRDPAMRANDSKTSAGVGSVLLGIVAIALAGMVGTIGLIHEIGEFGPKVGDIISFDPLDRISQDMRARLPAMLADDDARIEICVEGSFCPDTSFLGRDQNPVSRRNAACLGCFRMQLNLRIRYSLTQGLNPAMLTIAEQTVLRAG